jgi:hypothetical protein
VPPVPRLLPGGRVVAPVVLLRRGARRLVTRGVHGTSTAPAAVAVVFPDPQAAAAIGRNVFDPARRAPAARAGHAQPGPALDRVGAVRDGQRA